MIELYSRKEDPDEVNDQHASAKDREISDTSKLLGKTLKTIQRENQEKKNRLGIEEQTSTDFKARPDNQTNKALEDRLKALGYM